MSLSHDVFQRRLSSIQGQKGLLFRRTEAKDFCASVADQPATEVQKFFGSFFQKRTPFLNLT
jgi:hypothetical protein